MSHQLWVSMQVEVGAGAGLAVERRVRQTYGHGHEPIEPSLNRMNMNRLELGIIRSSILNVSIRK